MKNAMRKIVLIISLVIAFLTLGSKVRAEPFALPLKGCEQNTPCYVTAYVNHGNDNDHERDWNNGTRTYRSWSNTYQKWYYHKGTDIATKGQSRVIIVARAGKVTEVVKDCQIDNCTQQSCCSCSFNKTGNGLGNYIKIEHDDGTDELYGHMKYNSAKVNVGDIVICAQELGEVGSSGCSTGPHLHFQPEVNGERVDPFHGSNNASASLWVSQGQYDAVDDKVYDANVLPGTQCANGNNDPPPQTCTAPTQLNPTSSEKSTPIVTGFGWKDVKCGDVDANRYRIQVHTSPSFPAECENDQTTCTQKIAFNWGGNSGVNPTNDKPFTYSTTYYWRVRGGHTLGAGGDWSQTWSFTTIADPNQKCQNNATRACNLGCTDGTETCINGVWTNCNAPTKNSCGECSNTKACKVPPCDNPGTTTCTNGQWGICIGNPCGQQCVPVKEVCDGKDNNCDGQIDEGLMQSCDNNNGCVGPGFETCQNGKWVNCNAPKVNSCNSCTNTQDCSNACGPGTKSCVNGSWVNCTAPAPKAETCNNVDDDCNGKIDDNVTSNCSILPCNNPGIKTCTAGQWGICVGNPCAQPCVPVAEMCDAKDNDCNGKIDDGVSQACKTACGNGVQLCDLGKWLTCTAPQPNSCNSCSNTRSCMTACGTGNETCVNGAWVNCTAQVPIAETCNKIDDDCNGKVDDNLTKACVGACGNGTQTCAAGVWGACSAAGVNSCGSCSNTRACNSICGAGTETCSNGAWINCTARQPVAETCNNVDDDCNGQKDEGLQMACGGACGNGTQTCADGIWSQCNAPGVNSCGSCSNTRACQNACGNQGTETCVNGAWVNCNAAACPMLSAPSPISPANDWIKQVIEGNAASQSVSWSAVNGADHYEYIVRCYTSGGNCSIYYQGTTAGTSFVVGFDPTKQYGLGMEWTARAIDIKGNAGPWSTPAHFYFSHPTGGLIYCTDGNCLKPNNVYKVMGQFQSGSQGTPYKVILEWVSAQCLNGRAKTLVAGTHEGVGYYYSAAAGGCP